MEVCLMIEGQEGVSWDQWVALAGACEANGFAGLFRSDHYVSFGHPTEWGEAQAKDYTEHRYHQPSDEYKPEMDFTGDAVIAKFGFALGAKAAWLPTLAGWVPGDEFEAARKQSIQ